MLLADFEPEHIEEAAKLLHAKVGVCEVIPRVRLEVYEGLNHRVSLVCRHPDAAINCGASAEDCRTCLDKEKQYEHNREFNNTLKGFMEGFIRS